MRYSLCEMFVRVGVLAGSWWTKWKQKYCKDTELLGNRRRRNKKICGDLYACIQTLGSILVPDKWRPSVTHTHSHTAQYSLIF